MNINKLTNNQSAYNVNNKQINKKNNEATIDSSEKVAKSISVEANADMAKMEKLNNLAEQIKNKTFTVSPEAIAEKMIKDKGVINLLIS